MKTIGFLPNEKRDPGLAATRALIAHVTSRGCRALVKPGLLAANEARDLRAEPCGEIYAAADFLVVLGGDGSVLLEAKSAALADTPLIGVNLGRLGYLTDTDRDGAEAALDAVLDGRYALERRMMLEALCNGKRMHCLNEACAERGATAKLLEFDIRVNGEYLDTYRADGVIVCTPTGSTAYNLSAGGPILRPDAEMIAVTPICPHTLHARSFCLPSGDEICIAIGGDSGGLLTLDGEQAWPLSGGVEVVIRRAAHYATIIKTGSFGFYDVLRRKMLIK